MVSETLFSTLSAVSAPMVKVTDAEGFKVHPPENGVLTSVQSSESA
jgi:hypothetical protein